MVCILRLVFVGDFLRTTHNDLYICIDVVVPLEQNKAPGVDLVGPKGMVKDTIRDGGNSLLCPFPQMLTDQRVIYIHSRTLI